MVQRGLYPNLNTRDVCVIGQLDTDRLSKESIERFLHSLRSLGVCLGSRAQGVGFRGPMTQEAPDLTLPVLLRRISGDHFVDSLLDSRSQP